MFNSRLCSAATIRYSQFKFGHMHLCGMNFKCYSPHCCKCKSCGCTAAIRCGNACHGPHSDSLYSGSEHSQFNSPRLVKREAGSPNPRRALIGSNQLWGFNDSPYYREYHARQTSYIVIPEFPCKKLCLHEYIYYWCYKWTAHSTTYMQQTNKRPYTHWYCLWKILEYVKTSSFWGMIVTKMWKLYCAKAILSSRDIPMLPRNVFTSTCVIYAAES